METLLIIAGIAAVGYGAYYLYNKRKADRAAARGKVVHTTPKDDNPQTPR